MKSQALIAHAFLIILIGGNLVLAQTESINPGINESYLKSDLQVTEWVERFEREGREVFDNREEIIASIGIKPGMIAADIGTGTGLFLPLLADKVGANGKVLAVDIVPNFLKLVSERIEKNRWTNIETVLCTERSVELPKNSIDVAFICDVYHHFEYPHDSLASIRKALKPGGQIFLVDFKRIPGVSDEWILNHMRAGQEIFESEIRTAGFKKTQEIKTLLKDNYIVRFEKQ